MSEKNRGGRPPLGNERKRAAISIRVEPALYDAVVASARVGRRSFTREIERLLRIGLGPDAPEPKPCADMRTVMREEIAASLPFINAAIMAAVTSRAGRRFD